MEGWRLLLLRVVQLLNINSTWCCLVCPFSLPFCSLSSSSLSSPPLFFFFFQRFLYFISYIDRIPTYTILKKNKLPTPLNHRSPLLSLLPFANFSFSLSLFILSVFRSLSFSLSFTFTTTFPGLLRSTHYSPHSIHPPLPPPHFNNFVFVYIPLLFHLPLFLSLPFLHSPIPSFLPTPHLTIINPINKTHNSKPTNHDILLDSLEGQEKDKDQQA